MPLPRVGVMYSPRLYADLLVRALYTSIEPADFEFCVLDMDQLRTQETLEEYCLVILPLDFIECPDEPYIPLSLLNTRVIAFSPNGEMGLRHDPAENTWEEVRPFGLDNLINEVAASCIRSSS